MVAWFSWYERELRRHGGADEATHRSPASTSRPAIGCPCARARQNRHSVRLDASHQTSPLGYHFLCCSGGFESGWGAAIDCGL